MPVISFGNATALINSTALAIANAAASYVNGTTSQTSSRSNTTSNNGTGSNGMSEAAKIAIGIGSAILMCGCLSCLIKQVCCSKSSGRSSNYQAGGSDSTPSASYIEKTPNVNFMTDHQRVKYYAKGGK